MALNKEGVYIPPFRLAQMRDQIEDKSSETYQKLMWDLLRKSLNGIINKANISNLPKIIFELFNEAEVCFVRVFCKDNLRLRTLLMCTLLLWLLLIRNYLKSDCLSFIDLLTSFRGRIRGRRNLPVSDHLSLLHTCLISRLFMNCYLCRSRL